MGVIRKVNKRLRLLMLLVLIFMFYQVFNYIKFESNSHFIISSFNENPSESDFMINNEIIDKIDLSYLYPLNKSISLNFGKNIIEIRGIDNDYNFKDSIYYFGIYKFVVIDHISRGDFCYKTSFLPIGVQ